MVDENVEVMKEVKNRGERGGTKGKEENENGKGSEGE